MPELIVPERGKGRSVAQSDCLLDLRQLASPEIPGMCGSQHCCESAPQRTGATRGVRTGPDSYTGDVWDDLGEGRD